MEVFTADEELIAWFARLIGASLCRDLQGAARCPLRQRATTANPWLSELWAVRWRASTASRSRRDACSTPTGRPAPPPLTSCAFVGRASPSRAEPEQGAKFKGGTLKRLATIDQMTGRELHGRQEEWPPTHTLHLATNHLPAADDASEGFWRRIALVPWAVRFAKRGESGDGPAEDPGLATILAGRPAASSPGPSEVLWPTRPRGRSTRSLPRLLAKRPPTGKTRNPSRRVRA